MVQRYYIQTTNKKEIKMPKAKKVFQVSEIRYMGKIKPHVYSDGHVLISDRGSVEFVLVSASKFHEMEREIQKLKEKANA